jgi:nucleotide-binding universal stress UspA family protein
MAKREGMTSMEIRKILVPLDYSGDAHGALQWAASLAERYGARLILLHVISEAEEEASPLGRKLSLPSTSSYEALRPGMWLKHPIGVDLRLKARAALHLYAYKHLKRGIPVHVKVVVGKPAAEILRLAQEEKVDLIVMGTHGRTGWRRVLLGSVAEAVARDAPCAVFTVRGGGATVPAAATTG